MSDLFQVAKSLLNLDGDCLKVVTPGHGIEKINNFRNELPAVDARLERFNEIDNKTLSCQLENCLPVTVRGSSQMGRHVGRKSCSLDPLPSLMSFRNPAFSYVH